ncbi:MAG: HAMP domain-containing histidine kinase [Eubacterium sp.]|nr:HAMP domain-containing histidine kinase [Eubacterium sp.]
MKNKEFYQPIIIGTVLTVLTAGACVLISPKAAVLCAALGAVLLTVFAVYTAKRYRAISELNEYLSLVCSGHYELDLAGNAEGELSILQNNLYKVITRLKTQNEVIEQDRRYLADALADISHQLKTPLTSMLVVSELLEQETDPAQRREFTEIINSQCGKMSWLVQTLLKLSKLDAGTVALNRTPVSVNELVEESLQPFLLMLDVKGITVQKSITAFQVNCDKAWTLEALQNIIKNCTEHTPEGGRLEVTTDETTLFQRIVIRDNGCGIPKEELPHIFERFYHGKNASADSVGIGLALSKTVLNKQNASVAVTSEENVGTVFEVKFYQSVV